MNRTVRFLLALLGLSFVIVIHELGHFFACKWYGITTPVFSIGFGPTLFGVTIGTTFFQVAMLPLGGYVQIATDQLDAQPYYVKAIIMLAGIAVNIIFAYAIIAFYKLRSINVRKMMAETSQFARQGLMGPVGILSMISHSISLGFDHFVLLLGGLSFSVGIFNLLPIPFLDGGQLAYYTIEALTGPLSDDGYNMGALIFLILSILFMLYITIGDIRKLWR